MSSLYGRNEFLRVVTGGLAACPSLAGAEWVDLISGSSLSGWHKTGGADWEVKGGVITGRQGSGWASGDIYTDREWTDFELEAEWKMHWPANSGIWFRRTASTPGYQIDLLDPSRYGGIVSGSIYRMGKEGRGFIAENRDMASVKRESWNKIHLRMVGDHITVNQNGKAVVDVHDNRFPSGSLGIEVHGGKDYAGMEVSVRKLRARAV